MKVELVDISPVRKKIAVEVPEEEVSTVLKEAYESLKATAEVEGFRKGKVPVQILKQRFGADVLAEAGSKLIQQTFPKAVLETDIKPASRPEIEIKTLNEGSPFIYTAFLDVAPVIDVKGYRELKLERKPVEVTTEEVEEALTHIRESRGEFKKTEGPAKAGSMVTIDFACTVDDKPVEGGSAKGYAFRIPEVDASGTPEMPGITEQGARYPEFDEAAKGLKVGEKASFSKSFPSGFHDKNFAGKVAVFNLTVTGIKHRDLPVLDDDFARALGCDGLSDLRKKAGEEIEKSKNRTETDRLKGEAMSQLIKENQFDVPEGMAEKYYKMISGNVLEGVRRGMANPRDVNLTSDEFKHRYKAVAETQARGDIILEAIAEKEKVTATEEDMEKAVADLAASRGQPVESIRAMLDKEGALMALGEGIVKEKVFDLILDEKRIIIP